MAERAGRSVAAATGIYELDKLKCAGSKFPACTITSVYERTGSASFTRPLDPISNKHTRPLGCSLAAGKAKGAEAAYSRLTRFLSSYLLFLTSKEILTLYGDKYWPIRGKNVRDRVYLVSGSF